MRTTILLLIFGLLLLPLVSATAEITDRSYTGAHPELPANWDQGENWDAGKVPHLANAVHIGFSSPYVAVTGTLCQAFSLQIQTGGKLALRGSDTGKFLGILTDLTIESGGVFGTAEGEGPNGPIVLIGGNILNNGTFDLRGVCAAQEQVVLVGCHQVIRGANQIVFQNLRSLTKFTVDGLDVYVLGTYNGPWPDEINGGRFIVGESPLPITLAYFRAALSNGSSGVELTWRTLTEVDNYGFYVERRAVDASAYDIVAFVPTKGNGIVPHDYAYTDATAGSGTWEYRLRQVDLTGEETSKEGVRVEIQGVTGVADNAAPAAFALHQNYPNPFNPETSIRFSVQTAGSARLIVYDALGREVGLLFEGVAEPGRYYDVRFDGAGLSSGTYFYRLETAGRVDMKKMVLMK